MGLRRLGQPQPFDFATLKGQARALAQAPYKSHKRVLPGRLEGLDWDQYQSIGYRQDHALWADQPGKFQAKFFHLGLYFHSPVRMFDVVDGKAQELAYDGAAFNYGKSGIKDGELPADLGFAGFRLNTRKDTDRDFAAFLGASYFRAVGKEGQYGQSARGLAIDTGMGKPEEFPDFIAYYLEQPSVDSETIVVYGLLDSPSVAGAYRFAITNGDVLLMDIDSALYPRKAIERLGIAPCTSMYQVGENDRRMGWDWRPEIHDTDGLSLWTGAGEWIWQLLNPRNLRFNMFVDRNPRGFGLLQRDRNFDHYQDDGVFYEAPVPVGGAEGRMGRGSVQLVEIPTVDETFDNIVAFWNPKEKPQPGQELLVGYRLYWGAEPPARPPLAHCVASRTGLGGVVGKREYFSWRFAVDFEGGELAGLIDKAQVEAVVEASRGRVEIVSARPLREINGYRAMFDLVPPEGSTEQIDIRLFLRSGGKTLTETWLYQYTPPPVRCAGAHAVLRGVGFAGLAALHLQRPEPKQRQKLVSCGEAGWARLRGRCKYPSGAGPAAGGCAFGRLRSSASQAKRPHPCSSVAASMRLIALGVRSVFRRRTDLTFIRYLTDVSTKVDTHQQLRDCVRGGAVSECGVSAAWMRLPSTGTYLQRPRTPTPPRHSTECPLLPLLRLEAGAGLQALQKHPYSGRGACAGSIRPSPRVIFLNSARLTDT